MPLRWQYNTTEKTEMDFDDNNERHARAYEKALERGREIWEERLEDGLPDLSFSWAYNSRVEVEVEFDDYELDGIDLDSIEVDVSDYGCPTDVIDSGDLADLARDNVVEAIMDVMPDKWAEEHWEEFLEEEDPATTERKRLEGVLDGATRIVTSLIEAKVNVAAARTVLGAMDDPIAREKLDNVLQLCENAIALARITADQEHDRIGTAYDEAARNDPTLMVCGPEETEPTEGASE